MRNAFRTYLAQEPAIQTPREPPRLLPSTTGTLGQEKPFAVLSENGGFMLFPDVGSHPIALRFTNLCCRYAKQRGMKSLIFDSRRRLHAA